MRSEEAFAPIREGSKGAVRKTDLGLNELEALLKKHGFDPAEAKRLQAEGMGPFELEERLKRSPESIGGLTYTHGIEKK